MMKITLKNNILILVICTLFNSQSAFSDQHGIPVKYTWHSIHYADVDGGFFDTLQLAAENNISIIESQVNLPEGQSWGNHEIIEYPFPSHPAGTVNYEVISHGVPISGGSQGIVITCGHNVEDPRQFDLYCGCPVSRVPVYGKCMEPTGCKTGRGGRNNTVGNPCNVANGAKYYTENLDLGNGLTFFLSYSSDNITRGFAGMGWNSLNQPSLSTTLSSGHKIGVIRGNEVELMRRPGGTRWIGQYQSSYVEEAAGGFRLQLANGSIADGRLAQQINEYGHTLEYSYDASGQLISVVGSNTIEYQFEYDSAGNLIAIIYPDTTSDQVDNPRKIFHYENSDFPNHLTGYTDANGSRKASYAYDSQGRAISTEYASTTNSVGQERYQLDFQTN